MFLIVSFIFIFFILFIFSLNFFESNDNSENKFYINKKTSDISEPKFSINSKKQKISDIMHEGKFLPLAKETDKMSKALITMTNKSFGCVGVINKEKK